MPKPLIFLASASPRRSELLRQIGIAHEVRAVEVDETRRSRETATDYVSGSPRPRRRPSGTSSRRLSAARCSAPTRRSLSTARSSASRTAHLGPRDARPPVGAHARGAHGGRAGVHARCAQLRLSTSQVTFPDADGRGDRRYWLTGEPADKAGGYAVQGRAAVFVTRICGQLFRRDGAAAVRDLGTARSGARSESDGRRRMTHRDGGQREPARDARRAARERRAPGIVRRAREQARAHRAICTRDVYPGCCRACRQRSSTSASSARRSCTCRTSCSPPMPRTAPQRAAHRQHPRAGRARARDILVQVLKDPLGTKGARLTTFITIPSRYLVYHAVRPRGRRLGAHRERGRSGSGCANACSRLRAAPARPAATSCAPRRRAPQAEALRADMLFLRKLWEVLTQSARGSARGHAGARGSAAAAAADARPGRRGRRPRARRSRAHLRADARVRHDVHAGARRARRALRRQPPDLRPARRRGGDPALARAQGARSSPAVT